MVFFCEETNNTRRVSPSSPSTHYHYTHVLAFLLLINSAISKSSDKLGSCKLGSHARSLFWGVGGGVLRVKTSFTAQRACPLTYVSYQCVPCRVTDSSTTTTAVRAISGRRPVLPVVRGHRRLRRRRREGKSARAPACRGRLSTLRDIWSTRTKHLKNATMIILSYTCILPRLSPSFDQPPTRQKRHCNSAQARSQSPETQLTDDLQDHENKRHASTLQPLPRVHLVFCECECEPRKGRHRRTETSSTQSIREMAQVHEESPLASCSR